MVCDAESVPAILATVTSTVSLAVYVYIGFAAPAVVIPLLNLAIVPVVRPVEDINLVTLSPSPTRYTQLTPPPADKGCITALNKASFTLKPLGTFNIWITSPDDAVKLKGPPVIE